MKELDARYAKRVRTATAELIVYAKSMIKFMREYSDAMEKIGIVSYAAYDMHIKVCYSREEGYLLLKTTKR